MINNKNKIKNIFKDRNDFLEDYIKDNLPDQYYKNSFYRKIKNSKYIKDFEISSSFLKEVKNYWNQFEKIDLMWHQAYIATNSIVDVRYIPENIFYKKIEPTLNRFDLSRAYSDKNMYDRLFKDYQMPGTFIRNIQGKFYDFEYNPIDTDMAIEILQRNTKNNKMVLKPSIDSGGGKNIIIIDLREKTDEETIEYFYTIFKNYESDFIVQNYLEQHDMLSSIHKESLNTLRIMTLRYNNQIYVLSSIVRMGNHGSKVDNATVGGLTCGFDNSGFLNPYATDHLEYKKYSEHPSSGFKFNNARIPNYEECFDLVKNAHDKLLYFDIVSWDVAIDKMGKPNLIEVNLKLQDVNFHQRNNGPLFGELTDEILSSVYSK